MWSLQSVNVVLCLTCCYSFSPPLKSSDWRGRDYKRVCKHTIGTALSCLHNMLMPAGTSALLSICIPHCVPANSLVISSLPMNVNLNINSLLVNYPNTGVSIPKGWKGMHGHLFSHLESASLSNRVVGPNCDCLTRTLCMRNNSYHFVTILQKNIFQWNQWNMITNTL